MTIYLSFSIRYLLNSVLFAEINWKFMRNG